jgi:hypothetical protein
MNLSRWSALAFIIGTAGVLGTGCGDDGPIEAVTNEVTCSDVCSRYAECFDDDYDVEGCTQRCTDDTTAEEEKEEKLELCDECIDDESCTGAVFNCTTECAQFVP